MLLVPGLPLRTEAVGEQVQCCRQSSTEAEVVAGAVLPASCRDHCSHAGSVLRGCKAAVLLRSGVLA